MLYQIVSNVCDNVELFIEDEMTVAEVRALVGEMIISDGAENKTVRLTFQGHILDDDYAAWSSILSAFPIENNAVRKLFVHVSNGAKLESQSIEALRAALPSSSMTSEGERTAREQARMMEPLIDSISKNPAFVDSIIAAQPELQHMMRENPEMERALRDPETIKMMMLSEIDPDQRRTLTRNTQLQFAQISAMPGGEEMIERHAGKALRELEAGSAAPPESTASNVTDARPDATKEANSEALPNPWKSGGGGATAAAAGGAGGVNANVWNAMLAASGGSGASRAGAAGGNAGAQTPFGLPWLAQQLGGGNPNAQPPLSAHGGVQDNVRWAKQIAVLKDMGFEDEALCIEALRAANGDVDGAVNFIVDRLQSGY